MNLTIKGTAYYATMDEWNSLGSAPEGRIVDGVIVEYAAHVPGGMVKVRHNGEEVIIHPKATVELA